MAVLYRSDGSEVVIHHAVDILDALRSGSLSKVNPTLKKAVAEEKPKETKSVDTVSEPVQKHGKKIKIEDI